MTYPPDGQPPYVPGRPEDQPANPQPGYGQPGYTQGPYQPQPPPQVVVVQAPARPTSGTAVAAMVLGIIGVVFGCYTFAIPNGLAIILGHHAYKETKDGRIAGKGMAVAGLVLGYVMFAPVVAVILAGGMGSLMDALKR